MDALIESKRILLDIIIFRILKEYTMHGSGFNTAERGRSYLLV